MPWPWLPASTRFRWTHTRLSDEPPNANRSKKMRTTPGRKRPGERTRRLFDLEVFVRRRDGDDICPRCRRRVEVVGNEAIAEWRCPDPECSRKRPDDGRSDHE